MYYCEHHLSCEIHFESLSSFIFVSCSLFYFILEIKQRKIPKRERERRDSVLSGIYQTTEFNAKYVEILIIE